VKKDRMPSIASVAGGAGRAKVHYTSDIFVLFVAPQDHKPQATSRGKAKKASQMAIGSY
jgi:UTP:GlnB (protein PII) uridylyltransferase